MGLRELNRVRCLVVILGLTASAHVHAEPCSIVGDRELGDAVAGILATRGIDAGQCAAVHARIERRGAAIVVASDGASGVAVERTVNDPATAATVIESWVRTDLAAPLLAAHAVAIADPLPQTTIVERAPVVTISSGLHARATSAFETSLANDGTAWMGFSAGACVMIGPVCAAARVRFASVVTGSGAWAVDDRIETELLVGGDIPIRIGRVLVVPGFGGGIGLTATHAEERMTMSHLRQYSRTGGLRGDAHAAIEIPIAGKLALELTLGMNIAQGTHVETNTTLVFPDEPWLIGRVGAGLRYGGS